MITIEPQTQEADERVAQKLAEKLFNYACIVTGGVTIFDYETARNILLEALRAAKSHQADSLNQQDVERAWSRVAVLEEYNVAEFDRGLEVAAQMADQWATSQSCKYHDDDPCCHVRTGAGIATAIRELKMRRDSK
jgi:hypothetical protein